MTSFAGTRTNEWSDRNSIEIRSVDPIMGILLARAPVDCEQPHDDWTQLGDWLGQI